jgi:hypothetical protein
MAELYNHIGNVFVENDISKIEAIGMLHAFLFKIEYEVTLKIPLKTPDIHRKKWKINHKASP